MSLDEWGLRNLSPLLPSIVNLFRPFCTAGARPGAGGGIIGGGQSEVTLLVNGRPVGSVLLKLGLPLSTVGTASSASASVPSANTTGMRGVNIGGASFHGQLAGFRCVHVQSMMDADKEASVCVIVVFM